MQPVCILFFFLSLSSSVASRSHGIKQGEALSQLFYSKLQKKDGIDLNLFEEVQIFDESRIFPQTGLKEKDLIDKLPGQPDVDFDQYGGYVTVDENAGRAFYYYFAEAERSTKKLKPLLLWLNGGPGCSSLAFGAMEELGPFRVYSDGKTLYYNKYAWNKVANVLFLESPAGVGFSYSNRTSDYGKSGDKMTAEDNYAFLVNWLERFPEYKSRDFYISGESYAGHYVPQLAHTIIQHNKNSKNIINLKGIIIGNAVINDETDGKGMFDYFWTHALLSDKAIDYIHKYCNFSPSANSQPDECMEAVYEANTNLYAIDVYNIYAPICFTENLTDVPKKASLTNFDPCSDYYIRAYLNSPSVQKALHANVTKLNYTWESCSVVLESWSDSPVTIIPLLREIMANGLRVWVFSGDTDGRVPVTSTRYSLNKMNLPLKTSFYPWFHKGEVGGYTIVYKGDLTFATVRGAGHEVPSYQPTRALALIKHFLDGTSLPNH